MRKIIFFSLCFYQKISFLLPSQCIYIPSCSEYAKQAFLHFPFLKAINLTLRRLLRCHPFTSGGVDFLIKK